MGTKYFLDAGYISDNDVVCRQWRFGALVISSTDVVTDRQDCSVGLILC